MSDGDEYKFYGLSPLFKHHAGQLSRGLLLLTIVGSALALGSIQTPILLIVSAVATLSAVLAASRWAWHRAPLPYPVLWMLLLTGVTLLQVVPVPLAWLSRLAPSNADVWSGALAPLDLPAPRYAPLSLDPTATWNEVLKGWTYTVVFLSAAAAGARRGAAWGALVVFASAVIFGLVTLAHGLLDANRVFGIYQVRSGGSGFGIGPLVNPNNRAGYLNLGILCGASLLAMRRPLAPRWLIALGLAPTIGVSLLTGSRGGLLALCAGMGLLVMMLQRFGRERRVAFEWRHLLGIGGASAVIGVGFTIAAAGPHISHLLIDSNTSKLRLFASTLPLISQHAWFGIGRGAFESVFPAFQTAGDNTIFSHPENFLIQWTAEWGIVVTAVAVIAALRIFRPRVWGLHDSIPACGLFCGAISLAFHSLFDLGSEVPGIVIAGVAAAGFAWGANRGELYKSRRPGSGMLLLAACGLFCVTLTSLFGTSTLTLERDRLRAELPPAKGGAWPAFREHLASAMRRHPAEPYFPRLGAIGAVNSGTDNPLPWFNRALERGMSVGRTHYLLADYLGHRGLTRQAMLELRLTAAYDPALASHVAHTAVALTHDRGELMRVVPEDGRAGPKLLLNLAYAVSPTDPTLSLDMLRAAISRDPRMPEPRLLLARKLLERLTGDDPARVAIGDEALRALDGLKATSNEALQLRARVLVAMGRAKDASALLAERCAQLEEPLPCVTTWLGVAQATGDPAALRQPLSALKTIGCDGGSSCSAAYWAAGEAARVLGDDEAALNHFERAANGDNTYAGWQKVAVYANRIGHPERALRALRLAQAVRPVDKRAKDPAYATRRVPNPGPLSPTRE